MRDTESSTWILRGNTFRLEQEPFPPSLDMKTCTWDTNYMNISYVIDQSMYVCVILGNRDSCYLFVRFDNLGIVLLSQP